MEIQNHNALWFDQVEDKCTSLPLNTNVGESNIFNGSITGNNLKDKQYELNEALALNNMLSSSGESIENNQHAANMQYFEVFISYDINNPSELNS